MGQAHLIQIFLNLQPAMKKGYKCFFFSLVLTTSGKGPWKDLFPDLCPPIHFLRHTNPRGVAKIHKLNCKEPGPF